MLRSLVLAVLVALLSGCATRDVYLPKSQAISFPPLGEVRVATPGERLLSQGTENEYDAVQLAVPFTFSNFGSFSLPPGQYLKIGETSLYEVFVWDEITSPTRGGIRSADGEILKEVTIPRKSSTNGAILVMLSGKMFGADAVPFKRIKAMVMDGDSFQRTLIYSGRVGSKVNFSYREFSGRNARQAFTNAVEYDLSESMTVAYKGAKLEIVEATNQSIRYRVISNFTDAAR